MVVKLVSAAAAVAALGIGGVYYAADSMPTDQPGGCCGTKAVPAVVAETPAACPAEGGDCCDAMLAASRAQAIAAAKPKPDAEKLPDAEQK